MTDVQEAPQKVKHYPILRPDAGSGHQVVLEASPRRVRVVFNGETIAGSRRTMLMHETNHIPLYYFPVEDVRMDLMEKTEHSTHCPYKGDASYWSVKVGDRVADNAVWGYEDPIDDAPDLNGLVAFYWNKVDHWYEEDQELFIHVRDPYKRVDAVPSTSRVQVEVGGEIVADTSRATFLFETNLPTRYYIPAEDVRTDLLTPSDLKTGCPYKGTAQYHSLTAGGKTFENIVWYYPDPIPELPKVKDLLCFYNEKVDAIHVDGEVVPKQKSPWSDD